jgi:hypothetical protein
MIPPWVIVWIKNWMSRRLPRAKGQSQASTHLRVPCGPLIISTIAAPGWIKEMESMTDRFGFTELLVADLEVSACVYST